MVVDFARLAGHQAGPHREEHADRVFHALADPTRRDIAIVAMGQEYSVSALARRYPMSFAAVQKHVVVLERAGLVTKRRHGREQLVRGDIAAVRDAFTVLERLEAVWRSRIDRFGDVLAELVDAPPSGTEGSSAAARSAPPAPHPS